MPGITPTVRLVIAILAGIAGVISAALTILLQDNLLYLIKNALGFKGLTPPERKPVRIWMAYLIFVTVFVVGGAIAAIEPPPLPEKVTVSSPVEVGKFASVTVNTTPGAACEIEYFTPSKNKSTSQNLKPIQADANGICAWSWQIGSNTEAGVGEVILKVGDQTESHPIQITKP